MTRMALQHLLQLPAEGAVIYDYATGVALRTATPLEQGIYIDLVLLGGEYDSCAVDGAHFGISGSVFIG